jgi:hypothetical protein
MVKFPRKGELKCFPVISARDVNVTPVPKWNETLKPIGDFCAIGKPAGFEPAPADCPNETERGGCVVLSPNVVPSPTALFSDANGGFPLPGFASSVTFPNANDDFGAPSARADAPTEEDNFILSPADGLLN